MNWTQEQTERVMGVALRCWPGFKSDQAAQLLRALRDRHAPHVVSRALEELYATQERSRRPSPREVEAHIAGSADRPRNGRIAAYRELNQLESAPGFPVPKVGLRGRQWDACSSAVWNESGAIPLGDLTPHELDLVLRAFRELSPRAALSPEVPA